MKIVLEPGTYVVAVSGGVDSMVLLDLLLKKAKSRKSKVSSNLKGNSGFGLSALSFKLIVAHYDHGIREDSEVDRQLVQELAARHGLPFIYDEGRLGPGTSEDEARAARYKFLNKVRRASGADAVLTAHHQDDLIETAILNLIRGTNRKGLTSLGSDKKLLRPLLDMPKQTLLDYARKQKLVWREDVTNQDTKYRRNHVRHNIVNKLSKEQRQQFVDLLTKAQATNQKLDKRLATLLQDMGSSQLDRKIFTSLPHPVALEVLAGWLRGQGIRQFDKKLLENLVVGIKTLAPGKHMDVDSSHYISVTASGLALKTR